MSFKTSSLLRFFRSIGPGMIIAALVFGPGSLTVASKLGAGFGYALMWIVPPAILCMIAFTMMAGRIGQQQNRTLIQVIRDRYGVIASGTIGIGVFLITAAFQAGNAVGAGLALGSLTQSHPAVWIALVTGIGAGMLFAKSFYALLEKIMIALVALMLLTFGATLIVSSPNIGEWAAGFIPSIPDGSLLLVVALTASSFSIVGAFFQAYLVQAKSNQASSSGKESITGILTLGLITLTVMGSAASVLHPKGITVAHAGEMAQVLSPILGSATTTLFMIGLLAASFSSLVGNATIGGSILAETLGWGYGLQGIPVRICIIVVMLLGASVAIVFGRLPLELIVFAQGITILVAPLIGFFLLKLANDREIMGNMRNNMLINAIGFLGLLILSLLAIYYASRIVGMIN